jgi:hypothetical protein
MKESESKSEVLALGSMEAHNFHCEHCGSRNTLYILSGEDKFKCKSCGKKSAMNRFINSSQRDQFDWAFIGAQQQGRAFRTREEDNALLRTTDRDIRTPNFDRTYTVTITNTSPNATRVTIFGANTFLNQPNFGLPDFISVSLSETSYEQMLRESQSSPFVIAGFRMSVSQEEQLVQSIIVSNINSSGSRLDRDIAPREFRSPFSFQQNIVEVHPFEIMVTGETRLSTNLTGNTDVSFVFFISRRFSPSVLPFVVRQQVSLSSLSVGSIMNPNDDNNN